MTTSTEGAINNSFLDDAMSTASSLPKVLEQQIFQFGRAVLGIWTVPAMLTLRKDFGTQAIHPITGVLGVLVLQLVGLGSLMIPGPGVIDIWALYLVFMALVAVHGWRLRPLFFNMDLEQDGESEGRPWGVFNLLPFAKQPVIRCIYEPLALVVIPFVMHQVGLLTAEAGIYLAVVAFCHGFRNMLRYCELWTYIRDMRNSAYRAGMMRLMLGGRLSQSQADELVFTAGPAGLPKRELPPASSVDPPYEGVRSQKPQIA